MARWQLVVLSLAAVCLFAHVCSGTTIKSKAQLKDTPPYAQSDLNTMLNFYQTNVDVNNLGYTVAAQSQQNPNYWFHWVRDAAISMDKLRPWVSSAAWDTHMQHYTKWVLQVIAQSDPNGIDIRGEPKFFIPSGQVYNLPWGRPQNDGPALRAIVLMEYAQWLISQGRQAFVTQYLWVLDSVPPNDGAIKNDLEYVSHNWQNDCFDPWEEVNGNHFFTRMVQRKALILGAALGTQLGDTSAAAYYQQQAQAIEPTISAHWNPSTNVLMETMPPHNNPQKYDEIDTAVLLGVLYGYNNDNFYAPGNSQVLSTLAALQNVFTDGSFPINAQDTKNGVPGVLFGRYPNDTYDGVATNAHGNPWILCTNAVGEIFYREATAVSKGLELTQERLALYKRVIKRTTLKTNHATEAELRDHLIAALVDQGDDYLLRVRYHIVGGGLHMAEELDRNTGFETGAADLTWSYATVFSAMAERGNAFN